MKLTNTVPRRPAVVPRSPPFVPGEAGAGERRLTDVVRGLHPLGCGLVPLVPVTAVIGAAPSPTRCLAGREEVILQKGTAGQKMMNVWFWGSSCTSRGAAPDVLIIDFSGKLNIFDLKSVFASFRTVPSIETSFRHLHLNDFCTLRERKTSFFGNVKKKRI